MAINFNDYNKKGTGVYQNKTDVTKWMITVKINGKNVRKIIILPKDTNSNMAVKAMSYRITMLSINETKDDLTTMFESWIDTKSEWSDAYRYGMEKSYAKHIKPKLGSKAISKITTLDITKVLNQKLSLRVKKTLTEILFPLFNYAVNNKLISTSPIIDAHRIKRDSAKEKKVVNDAPKKYKAVYAAIMKLESPRDRALMLFGFHGRRKSEALTLRWVDIRKDEYTIRKEVNKVDEDMTYTLNADINAELSKLDQTGVYVFESPKKQGQPMTDIRDIVSKVRDNCGLPEFTYHWMRNLAVSALYQEGVATSEDLSAMLGHTDLNTLRKYLTDDKKRATARTSAAAEMLLR